MFIYKPVFAHLFFVVYISAVYYNGSLHNLPYSAPRRHTKLLPLGNEQYCICSLGSIIHIICIHYTVSYSASAFVHCYRVIYFHRTTCREQFIYHHQRRSNSKNGIQENMESHLDIFILKTIWALLISLLTGYLKDTYVSFLSINL